jgi:hypothetical protein
VFRFAVRLSLFILFGCSCWPLPVVVFSFIISLVSDNVGRLPAVSSPQVARRGSAGAALAATNDEPVSYMRALRVETLAGSDRGQSGYESDTGCNIYQQLVSRL